MATIKEIAKLAGVGTTTVSRYLNNGPYISEEKRHKIEEAIKQLDYVPSSAAKMLRANNTKQIGVIVSRITNPYFATLFDYIERLLNAHGYEVSIMQTYDDPAIERRILDKLKNDSLDAILMASVEDKTYVAELIRTYPKRIVLVNEKIAEFKQNSITIDQYQATYTGLEYLYEKYCTPIIYITGSSFFTADHGGMRNDAYLNFLKDHQLPLRKELIFTNLHNIEDGLNLVPNLLPLVSRTKAIFANSDEVAIGIIAGLQKNGLHVPTDVAVMGFDNQPISAYTQVPLTTISQPIAGLANNAVKLLLDFLGVKNSLTVTPLSLEMIVRQSA
ncbi:LacI family DNA-binding transcriptional regulator [Ligilactobacillus agilis]|uniref:LacI family DNA-binding transcriptional regulator n=1 Tax=Ligilactobacillus agilis TaxID=1601 RepID=UPI001437DBDF|nr:LacI family DNA-binding transcriptional regulator [Ligilactobacillus agilis]GET10753.1 LacI family transcriptional regulator [Ligilactobacillus agilis]